MNRPDYGPAILAIEVAEMVVAYCNRTGKSDREKAIALDLAGRCIADGESNPARILSEVDRRLREDGAVLMEESIQREEASRRARTPSREIGAKPGPRGRSPHNVSRSNKRTEGPSGRWDLDEGGQG